VFWATVTVIAALLGWVIDARVSAPRSTCRVKCE